MYIFKYFTNAREYSNGHAGKMQTLTISCKLDCMIVLCKGLSVSYYFCFCFSYLFLLNYKLIQMGKHVSYTYLHT